MQSLNQRVRKVINASGRMTHLGVSLPSQGVKKAMDEALGNYYVMEELYAQAGAYLAELLDTSDACVTGSASAGIVLSLTAMRKLSGKNEVVLMKGHNINYGIPVSLAIETANCKAVEAGSVNKCTVEDLAAACSENTAAVLYVKSHHCTQKGMLSLAEIITFAHKKDIVVIVDAAAELDLFKYYRAGADCVIYSGAKAVCGPTSGFVLCQSQEVGKMMRALVYDIGRILKVGKETIFGLCEAVREYLENQPVEPVSEIDIDAFVAKVNEIKGLRASKTWDEAGRPIFRASIKVDADEFGMDAETLTKKLESGNPAIYTRNHQLNLGILAVDSRPLRDKSDLDLILKRILEVKS
ncbi:MAG: aminotransferase class V-fold PLP-dependent enzyme [Erysipelotrichaceae bacterium]|nr:aminotransferase class V-fold PLP-dependent enzyme [Erysipelotrichaceae bacterium]